MRKTLLRTGSIIGMLAVVIGAFGAHALKEAVSPEFHATFEVGVHYHFFHTFAIFLCAILMHFGKKPILWYGGLAFAVGILLFSGSLYLLSLQEIMAVPIGALGPITPIGGLCFIAGWIMLFISTYQKAEKVKVRKRRYQVEEVEA